MSPRQLQDAELRRLARLKRLDRPGPAVPLGGELVSFFKQVDKRHHKLGHIGQCWANLVPELIQEHCCIESMARGTLTVLVDSSSHLYELRQLLLSGLEKQLLLAGGKAGLRKISLKIGRWYNEGEGGVKLTFD